MKRRRSKVEIERDRAERERLRIERWKQEEQREREKLAAQARKREEAKRREWIRKQRSRPRTQLPAEYGESIFIHERILDGFMKQVGKKIEIESSRVEGGAGGKLIIHYTTRHGGRGALELNDLGTMPVI